MSADPTGFPADPREQPQWCNTSAGPLENPMIQCLPPPYPGHPAGGHVNRDMAEQCLDGWMVPTLFSWWAGEDLSEKPLREGKWPHFPTTGNGPWCQDTSVSGLPMPQESCMFPGVCSLTPSSSLLSSNKIHCWSSAHFVFKTQHLVKSCTQLSRTFEPWPMFLKHLISFWFTSNVCINSTWCICCMFPSTNQ